ncbi:polysaccharide pyruvyl transferase family protein [Methylorubrum rhodesianum]|uniref:Polysaccharide pyruvyl transferase family protein n=1 Tax=Methylorubrum rhodesianum TaxID=29427 RepID=A0ABU9ZHJ3_9HYPH
MRIGIGHYADVRNYGDYLFPLIMRQEILKRIPEATITFFGATDDPCGQINSVQIREGMIFDVALFAGGEVVHCEDDMLSNIYNQFGIVGIEKPTDVVFRLPEIGEFYSAWIGLGVPSEADDVRLRIEKVAPKLNHIAFRGYLSAEIVRRTCPGLTVNEVPDLGWLINTLDNQDFNEVLGDPYIIAQGLEHHCDHIDDVANALHRISYESGFSIRLMPVTDCWNDESFVLKLNHAASGRFGLVWPAPDYLTRRKIIEKSKGFVGSSLHGAITAMSSGLPAAIIYRPNNDQKFRETLIPLGLGGSLAPTWLEAPSAFQSARKNQNLIWTIANLNRGHLKTYFDFLCREIRSHVPSVGAH